MARSFGDIIWQSKEGRYDSPDAYIDWDAI